MRHRIVFGDYRDRISRLEALLLFVKISKGIGREFQIRADQNRLEPLRRARPSSALKDKFKALRDLSHKIWPEVVEKLEREKRERKERKEGRSKPAVPITFYFDDVVVASEPVLKKKWVGSPRLRDSPSPSLRSSSIASRLRRKRTSSSAPKKVPGGVVELESPPSDHDGNVSRRDDSASRHEDDMSTPPCGTLPVREEEFLTSRDDGPSFNRGGFSSFGGAQFYS
ncbi:unnamed protein product [Microthlaspi erraticum]|uniref:Uncharacterized protein n=1 Tax=Microthlaspi erraticum TaxID=1685480 RepID=A0A6D2JI59_9BRAS|nr:unnamed protein product [Microthlaspi erraticum]